jgi:flavorubredoxin
MLHRLPPWAQCPLSPDENTISGESVTGLSFTVGAAIVVMQTHVAQIADGIYRFSTFVPDIAPPAGFTFNQFLILAEQPLLFHCGPRGMFPLVSAAVSTIIPIQELRWISFGHVESDECGAMNLWLEAAPDAQVVFNPLGCMVSINDLADRPPRPLTDEEVLNLGGKRVRIIATPHVPHGWEAQVLFEETTKTLFCGDLFTHLGDGPPTVRTDIVPAAMAAEDAFHATSIGQATAPTIRKLAQLKPGRLAIMHGSSFEGDAADQLARLADAYEGLAA